MRWVEGKKLILWGSLKNLIFRRDSGKKYLGGDYLKKGAWTVCRLKGCGKKEVGGVFEGS